MPVFSQNEAEKWGKIPPADLAMTVYPQDSGAAAVILQDVGSVRLQDYGKYTVVSVSRYLTWGLFRRATC